MKDEGTRKMACVGPLHKRRTTLEDRRYLIYYTFGEDAATSRAEDEAASKREPVAEAVAEEGRSV